MAKFNLSHITLNALKEEEFIVDKLIERTVPESASYLISIYPLELTDNILNSHNDRFSFIGRVRAIFEKYKAYGLLLNFEQNGYGIRYQFYSEVVYQRLKEYQKAIKSELNKKEKLEGLRARLTLYPEDKFVFQAPDGVIKEAQFTQGTNEHAILMFFVDHQHQKFSSSQLVIYLAKKEPRRHSDPEQERRVKDAVKAIRKKLGKEVIVTDGKGFRMDCELVRV